MMHTPTVAKPVLTKNTRIARLERRLADRVAARHLARMASAKAGSTRSTFWWRSLIFLVALPVHLVSVGLVVGGLALALVGTTWPEEVIGVLLLMAAYGTHPHLPRRPEHVARLTPDDAPRLFGMIREVATTSGARVPDEVLIVPDFNAFATRVGWRRTPVMGIGAPLWFASSGQQRVALIGHELGHFAHRDLSYGLWVSTALQTLFYWNDTMLGTRRVAFAARGANVGFLQAYLLAPVRGLIQAYMVLIVWLRTPSRQRQEYLADLDAVRAAGSEGAVGLFDVLLNVDTVSTAMTRAAVHPERPDMWDTVAAALAEQPHHFVEGRRRHSAMKSRRINDSHPATHLRIRLVQAREQMPATVVLDTAWSHAIDRELEPGMTLAAKRIGDRVRYQR
jgi:Zn-dependent protease with chaperone function